MYASIRADRMRCFYSQRSPVLSSRSSLAESLSASREGASQSGLFGSGAMELTPLRQREPARFRFAAPAAATVKLVADFTGWEKLPIELRPDDDGIWEASVKLPPGRYAYRFLVDGEWCDDPECQQCEVNPFGTHNAVFEVQ